jgi:Beta-lactamase enzyme family
MAERGVPRATGLVKRLGLIALAAAPLAAGLGAAPALAGPVRPAAPAEGPFPVTCASRAHPQLAARLAQGLRTALRGRVSTVALRVDDRHDQLGCWLNAGMGFDSASVVKVTILGTLLREAMTQHRALTSTEARLAAAMITRSDNAAASALWAHVGRGRLQYFLGRAGMTQTRLGPGGYWGLTQITAHDELLLLNLLQYPNLVLDTASRGYALGLMARVIPAQRWGVPAGAPASLTVHVKNGWLPLAPHRWRINSIGCFTGRDRGYAIAVLTQDNPTMGYGITTIERAAEVIHHQLSPGAAHRVPPSRPAPGWGVPDELIPPAGAGR